MDADYTQAYLPGHASVELDDEELCEDERNLKIIELEEDGRKAPSWQKQLGCLRRSCGDDATAEIKLKNEDGTPAVTEPEKKTDEAPAYAMPLMPAPVPAQKKEIGGSRPLASMDASCVPWMPSTSSTGELTGSPETEPTESSPSRKELNQDSIYRKTKRCRFFNQGQCTKAENCPYAHSEDELKPVPDLFRTKICRALQSTGRCTDQKCRYAHSEDERRKNAVLGKNAAQRFGSKGFGTGYPMGWRKKNLSPEQRLLRQHQEQAMWNSQHQGQWFSDQLLWTNYEYDQPAFIEVPVSLCDSGEFDVEYPNYVNLADIANFHDLLDSTSET